MASEKKNSKKLNNLNYILYFAIGLLFITLYFYFYNFNNGLSDDSSNWGTFGDFIGGTLNPIFALFSLFAIIYTIKIQTEELELSREELKETKEELRESRIAQQEQSESLKLQNESTRLQSFENTFFKLFDLFNLTKNTLNIKVDIKRGHRIVTIVEINGKEFEYNDFWVKYGGSNTRDKAIILSLNILKVIYNSNYEEFNLEYESVTGAYFGQIYQILKFVDESTIKNKNRYINIFRSQFTKEELEFMFYHCLGQIGKKKFKGLVEKYEFFEHISLHNATPEQYLEYDKKVFGKNEEILEIYKILKENLNN